MRKILILGAALAVAAAFIRDSTRSGLRCRSRRRQVVQVFVATQTVTTSGVMANYFAPGSTVVFRAYAVDQKTKKVLAANDVRYFYVTIPGQPNVKLKYNPTAPGATAAMPWVGTWTVPATYRGGDRRLQGPDPDDPEEEGPVRPDAGHDGAAHDLGDAAARRCRRACRADDCPAGEPRRLDLRRQRQRHAGRPVPHPGRSGARRRTSTSAVSSSCSAPGARTCRPATSSRRTTSRRRTSSIAGQPDVKLNWGAHGTAGSQVFFWSNAWNIPADLPAR